jgi:hypothetical protein
MGTVALRRRRSREGLHGLSGREVRRPASRDRSDIGQHASGIGSAVRGGACGALTLDELISDVWEGLGVQETALCPACGGAMALRGGGGAPSHAALPGDVPHGDCVDCGAQLF